LVSLYRADLGHIPITLLMPSEAGFDAARLYEARSIIG
jgi:hypothetical protein